MRSFRRRSQARLAQRMFWVRNTGLINTAAAGTAASVVLFNPLNYLPDPTIQRADIGRNILVVTQHLNYSLTNFATLIGGTSIDFDMYMGVALQDRNLGAFSPAFSTAPDARCDWMDCWMDFFPDANSVAGTRIVSQGTLGIANKPGMQRQIKSKRRLRSEDEIRLHMVFFPHTGTATGTYSQVAQWQYSALVKVS